MGSENKSIFEKVSNWAKPYYLLFLGLIIATIFFSLGRLSSVVESKEPIKIEYTNTALDIAPTFQTSGLASSTGKVVQKNETAVKTEGNVIGAKTSKKYYYPWCGTVKRIKAVNQIFFRSISEAKSAGYTPGGNCKGLY